MATKTQKTKVGIFLVVCFVLITIASAYLSGYHKDSGVPFWLSFDESVLGLYEGGLVEYLGVPVGQVQSIRVTENNRAHVDIVINPEKVTLNKGVKAQLVLYSIAAGTMAVELTGGDPEAGPLESQSQIFTVPSRFASISTQIEDFMEDLSRIAEVLNASLEGIEEGDIAELAAKASELLDDGKAFIEDGRTLVGDVNVALSSLTDSGERITNEFLTTSEDIRALTGDTTKLVNMIRGKVEPFDTAKMEAQLSRILTNMGDLSERLNAAMDRFEAMSANALHEADNIEHTLRETLREMNEAFVSVNALVNQIKADPASLVRGRSEVKGTRP